MLIWLSVSINLNSEIIIIIKNISGDHSSCEIVFEAIDYLCIVAEVALRVQKEGNSQKSS